MSDPHVGPASPQKPVQLDYRRPQKPQSFWPAYDRWRARIPTDPQLKRWWWRRGVYYAGLTGLFTAIAFYFGPNLVLFGHPLGLSPADFVRWTQVPDNLAAVRAIKRFRADHGRMPRDERELVPAYIEQHQLYGDLENREFVTYWGGPFEHKVTYRFSPKDEGWWVEGRYANGRIPAPLLALGPATCPATKQSR